MNPTQTSFANDAKVFFMRAPLFMLFLFTLSGIGIQHAYADDSALLSHETLLKLFEPESKDRTDFIALPQYEKVLVLQYANEGKNKALDEMRMRRLASSLIRFYQDSRMAEQIIQGKQKMVLIYPIEDSGRKIDKLIGGQFASRGKAVDVRYQALDSYKQAKDADEKRRAEKYGLTVMHVSSPQRLFMWRRFALRCLQGVTRYPPWLLIWRCSNLILYGSSVRMIH